MSVCDHLYDCYQPSGMLTFDLFTMTDKKHKDHFILTSINYEPFVNGAKAMCQNLSEHSFLKTESNDSFSK